MTPPSGHDDSPDSSSFVATVSSESMAFRGSDQVAHLLPEQIERFVNELEVPFDESVIEWRVTNTAKRDEIVRGQLIPYADQRAYTDRLNALFTPAGWTRRYAIHTTANFQRSHDEKLVGKVFVTCEVAIFGLGSHSATGEEWTDDENAVTAAEAQSFKRACACFGLGRYLYYFSGIWVDLDERKRPSTMPALAGWATPEGWRKGLRPDQAVKQRPLGLADKTKSENPKRHGKNSNSSPSIHAELVRQIEAMAEPLGKGLYRGLLKTIAVVWNPGDIQDGALLEKVLKHMQSAERGLFRLKVALDKTGSEMLAAILRSMNIASLDRVDNLETLRQIVLALEADAEES